MKKSIILSFILATFCFGIKFEVIDADMKFNKDFNLPFVPNIGYGSGAFHMKNDEKDIIYTITDRGINIDCKDTKKILGDEYCKEGKVFPYPEFSPTIFKLKITDNGYEILQEIKLKTSENNLISGVSNPNTEPSFSLDKKEIYDVNGMDSEALAIASDGIIYIADEYGPSIFIADKNGVITERLVPKGVAKTLNGATYKITECFPSKLRERQLNRGLEAIAISNDEKKLYTILQSPYKDEIDKKIVPFFVIDRAKKEVLKTFLYPLDDVKSFTKDNKKKIRKQNDVKISEMSALPDGNLVVLERISKTTKFYKINPKNVQNGVLQKELIFSTDNYDGFPSKIEAIAIIDKNNWILINDNDFGIENDKTQIIKVNLEK